MSARPFLFRASRVWQRGGGARLLLVGLVGGAVACTEPGDDGGANEPPACTSTAYRIVDAELASTWGDAVRLGLDLDGDGQADNKLGSLNATLTQVYGDWQPEVALRSLLVAGSTAWLARIDRCEASPRLAVAMAVGVEGGDGVFEVADWGEPAVGDGVDARGGVGVLPIGRIGAGAGPAGVRDDGWSPELGLAVRLQPGGRTATIGMGVAVTDELLAPVASFLSAALARGDSRFADGLDLDRDGRVSVAELRQAPAVRALLAADLDLAVPCDDGECYAPGMDGVDDRISIGLGITLAPVRVR